jgi:hypothetical protein
MHHAHVNARRYLSVNGKLAILRESDNGVLLLYYTPDGFVQIDEEDGGEFEAHGNLVAMVHRVETTVHPGDVSAALQTIALGNPEFIDNRPEFRRYYSRLDRYRNATTARTTRSGQEPPAPQRPATGLQRNQFQRVITPDIAWLTMQMLGANEEQGSEFRRLYNSRNQHMMEQREHRSAKRR